MAIALGLCSSQIKSFKAVTQDPNTFVQLPLQSAVHREIARYRLSQVCTMPVCNAVVVLPIEKLYFAVKWSG
jgi:hypothetical protein